jgi:4-amino-4-deoxy-L-arabinose transferase-like glycosyltransferase
MNPTTLFAPALVVFAAVVGRWLLRRNPTVNKHQLFAAFGALVGGLLSASNPTSSAFWFYTGSTIAATSATFLFFLLLRHWGWDRSGPTTRTT